MTTVLKYDFNAPGLNGKNGLMRMHWTKKAKWKTKIKVLTLEQTMKRHKGQVRITYKRFGSKLMDVCDNLPASMKFFIDGIVAAKTISDDNPSIIPFPPTLEQEIGPAATIITIEDIES